MLTFPHLIQLKFSECCLTHSYMYLQWHYYTCITAQPSSLKKYKEGLAEEEFQTPAYFFQMNSCQVEEGRLARFDCRVVAHPKPEITWFVRNWGYSSENYVGGLRH